jgi:hypothetical protein
MAASYEAEDEGDGLQTDVSAEAIYYIGSKRPLNPTAHAGVARQSAFSARHVPSRRRIKRPVRPGFGGLRTARWTLAGCEAIAMIRK